MLISGVDLKKRNTSTVTILRDGQKIPLIVTSLPFAFWPNMRARGLSRFPEPPMKPKMNGRKYEVDPITKRVITEPDTNDHTYLEERARISRRLQAVRIREYLREDSRIDWGVSEPEGMDHQEWVTYADALATSIENSGLTEDEIAEIINEGEKTGKPVDIEAGVNDFLEQD